MKAVRGAAAEEVRLRRPEAPRSSTGSPTADWSRRCREASQGQQQVANLVAIRRAPSIRPASRISRGMSLKKVNSIHTTIGRLHQRIQGDDQPDRALSSRPPVLRRQHVDRHEHAHGRQHLGRQHPQQGCRGCDGVGWKAMARRRPAMADQAKATHGGAERDHHAVEREAEVVRPGSEHLGVALPASDAKSSRPRPATAACSVLKLVRTIQEDREDHDARAIRPAQERRPQDRGAARPGCASIRLPAACETDRARQSDGHEVGDA